MSKQVSEIEKVLKKAPQHTRKLRHALSLIRHSTPKKLLNLVLIELQRLGHRTKVLGYPYLLIVDTGNICNLRCPLCPTGLKTGGRDEQLIKFENLKEIIDKLYPYAYEVSLHNWGEPFLNPEIFKMIGYCVEKNVGTNLSTNLSVKNIDVEALIKSGLENLAVSLDGTTQDVYKKYRVRGNIELVFRNLKEIIKAKKNLKSKTPYIEWQFILMKHNYHQVEEAKRLAKQIGVDELRFIPVGFPFDSTNTKELEEEWCPNVFSGNGENYIEKKRLQKPIMGGCFYIYRSITINPIGAIAPCCAVWKEKDDFGNILNHDFSEIWNNHFYQSARSLFSKKRSISARIVCNRCNIFVKP